MKPKLQEMDGIVATIYQAMTTNEGLRNTVLILCGDHGMTSNGNHGGSTEAETSAGLVFISPALTKLRLTHDGPIQKSEYLYFKKIQQADLVPTISFLLGLELPRDNLGLFIPEFLDLWPMGMSILTTC